VPDQLITLKEADQMLALCLPEKYQTESTCGMYGGNGIFKEHFSLKYQGRGLKGKVLLKQTAMEL
jgi:hypothetical protein